MTTSWYQQPKTDDGPILSSRVRLARNVRKYPFQQKITPQAATRMVRDAQVAISLAPRGLFHQMDMQALGATEQQVFLEKHIISPEFLQGNLPRGLLISDDQNLSVMLNEEDHVRIQSVQAGDDLTSALSMANQIDDLIEERVEYAFHPDYGYLTACPTNIGTGLRASYMIHLPCLERLDKTKSLLPVISKFGITLRGIYGEGTESMGGIYQISNQTTLGKSEADIIQCLQNVTKKVLDHESLAREHLLNAHYQDVEDQVHRAYGLLTYSRKMSGKEAMSLLSDVRLGYLTGLLTMPRPPKRIYQIMMEIQPGHLQRVAGTEMNDSERDAARATYLRRIWGCAPSNLQEE